jgi:hypothetical protein
MLGLPTFFFGHQVAKICHKKFVGPSPKNPYKWKK